MKGMEFPLKWPAGRERTPKHAREDARFQMPLGAARDDLVTELKRFGARYACISTNIPRNQRGRLPADYPARSAPEDPGVAVYFLLDNEQHCLTCDQWTLVEDNIRAISKTIEAMRGIERWGSSKAMKAAMSGFKALPPSGHDWRAVLGLSREATLEDAKAAHRTLAMGAHPDRGGDPSQMVRLNQALDAAKQELGR